MRTFAVTILLFLGSALHAQGLRLRVVDAQSGNPVPLALVTLLRDGEEQGEGMTRMDGTRFFPADPAARYQVLVRRPGLQAVTVPEVRVSADTAPSVIRVPATPFDLRATRTVPRECALDRLATATQTLREHAQATLRLAEIARADGLEAIAIRRLLRSYDRDGNPRDEQEAPDAALGARLFRTVSSAELSRRGFARTDSMTGLPVWLGPDIAWFTSAEFAAGHCLGVVEGRDLTAGMVGLEFTPRDRATAQTSGVMWFDRETGLLRVINFTLTGGAAVAPTGRIALEPLPSGVWIARDWSLRAPVTTAAGQLLGFREEAGEALQVSATMLAVADSITNSRRPPGRINGVVIDSLTRRPLAAAVVTVGPAGPSARTDSSGTFAIRSVPTGHHALTLRHPLLDSVGTRVVPRVVRVGPDSTTHVVLAGPSLRALKGGACHDSLAVLTGRVRDVTTNAPVDSVRVILSWIEIMFRPNRPLVVNPVEIAVDTDSSGRYAACVPARLEVTVNAEAGTVRTGRVDVRPEDRGLAVLDLAIDPTATDTLFGSAAIQGIVEYQDRTPLANATVMLTDPMRTVTTDSAGRFRIASIPGGTRVLDTRALGHAAVRTVVDARMSDTATVRIFLRRVTQLDAVVVRASAGAASRALRELEERRQRGQGYRLTPVELLAFRYARMDAVARALPFTTVQWQQGLPRILLSGRGGRMCDANVYVDGQRSASDVIGDFPASEVLAVEFFRSDTDVPLRYKTSNDCGAILVWTREGVKASDEAAARRQRP